MYHQRVYSSTYSTYGTENDSNFELGTRKHLKLVNLERRHQERAKEIKGGQRSSSLAEDTKIIELETRLTACHVDKVFASSFVDFDVTITNVMFVSL